jgi:hypothetical protein
MSELVGRSDLDYAGRRCRDAERALRDAVTALGEAHREGWAIELARMANRLAELGSVMQGE